MGLAPAQYTIQIYAHNTITNSWTIFERTTTVTATPLHTIETPETNQGVTQPFALTGWAIDGSNPTGTGVDAVDVSGYHNFGSGSPLVSYGAATYGGSRPAVSALYGARFDPSGYTKTLSTLTAGWYWFVVSSHNVRDNSWTVRTQTAFVDIPLSTLNITRGGTGTGGITASPSMVSCPGGSTTQAMPCPEATYPTGTIVTLTAVPDAGSTFAGWVGACSGTAPCPILLNGARHVTAMFAKIPGSIETRYYHTDVIGSVRAITDETGAVVIRHDYAPFGEEKDPDMTGDAMRFAGKELDPETGMNYFAARYYRNAWGRFASVDPLQVPVAMTDPQQWNRYAYARNNPLAFTDPSGLCTMRSDNISDGCTEEVTVTASGGTTGTAPSTTPSAGTPTNPLLSNGIGSRPGNNSGAQTFINANGVCGWAHPDDPSELYFTAVCPEAETGVGLLGPSWLDVVQGVLDVVSIAATATVVLEPIGMAADVINATTSAIEGDWLGMSASLWGALPWVGVSGNLARLGRHADGAHTVLRTDLRAGRITHYGTRIPQTNPRNPNPWQQEKRFDGVGPGHYNKVTGDVVPTPHVHDSQVPGGVRPPTPGELPRGY